MGSIAMDLGLGSGEKAGGKHLVRTACKHGDDPAPKAGHCDQSL